MYQVKMYDLSSKFNTFYNSHVVLSQAEQTNLHSKKDLNIQRLKDGLKEYNEEHNCNSAAYYRYSTNEIHGEKKINSKHYLGHEFFHLLQFHLFGYKFEKQLFLLQ